jgi:ATP-binding cassette subfamily F protein 3
MVSVRNISVSFGSFDLLSEISFLVNSQDRIGLAGKNGAGKSTLLRIIAGLQTPTSGQVDTPNDFTIGYLPQQMKVSDTTSVINETLQAFSDLRSLADEVEKCSHELAGRTDYETKDYLRLCDHLAVIEERYRYLGGINTEAETEKALTGLGFERKDFDRPTRELSGGWRMRIELAKILLRRPDLILLDEPTNHLDIESIQWIESFLENYPGAVVVVSHDRAFLDNVTNRTIEISLGKIYDYKVSWSQFVVLRNERREQQIAAFRNQQKMIDDTEKFIERFRYKATKAVQVQSKIKQLGKIERLEVDDEDNSALAIRFAPAPRSGSVVVNAEDLSVSFGKLNVLNKVSLTIERGEKVAFVGRNGEGKTTLSRAVLGELIPEGSIKTGHNVRIGYFAQNQDILLDENKTVFQTIDDVAKGDIRTKIRDMLGAFLFRGEDIDKKVKVLSGGERSRLALVKLLLEPYNLLVLDEPTNHLDMRSKDILKQALKKYDGTLIVVSHDRDFLDGLVDRIFEFRNKALKEHRGGIYDFLRKKKMESLRELEIREKKMPAEKTAGSLSDSKKKYEEKKDFDRKLKKIQKTVEETEAEIEKIEREISLMDAILSSPGHGELPDDNFYSRYTELKESLTVKMVQWEEQHNEAEKFRNSIQ